MGIFRGRRLSREDLALSFAATAFPIHVWAIINVLEMIPAWLLRLSVWELAGAISYPLVAALLESCALCAGLVGLSYLLPQSWLADKFVARCSILVWTLSAWAVLVHFTFDRLLRWGPEQIIPGLLLVVLSLGVGFWAIQRSQRLEKWTKGLSQNLTVLIYVYLGFDLVGLAVVILRNLYA